MALSETGTWLEHALRALTADGESVLQLDDETMYSLVSYCEMAAPADASEYLLVLFPGTLLFHLDCLIRRLDKTVREVT